MQICTSGFIIIGPLYGIDCTTALKGINKSYTYIVICYDEFNDYNSNCCKLLIYYIFLEE